MSVSLVRAATLALGVAVSCCGFAAQLKPWSGAATPALVLKDMQGKEHNLAAYRGSVVLINFWATWCEPCKREMPFMQTIADSGFTDAQALGGFKLISIDRDEPADTVQPFLTNLNLTLPVALDAGGTISNRYGVIQMPVTFFIDPAGKVRYKHLGELTPEILQRYVQKFAGG